MTPRHCSGNSRTTKLTSLRGSLLFFFLFTQLKKIARSRDQLTPSAQVTLILQYSEGMTIFRTIKLVPHITCIAKCLSQVSSQKASACGDPYGNHYFQHTSTIPLLVAHALLFQISKRPLLSPSEKKVRDKLWMHWYCCCVCAEAQVSNLHSHICSMVANLFSDHKTVCLFVMK